MDHSAHFRRLRCEVRHSGSLNLEIDLEDQKIPNRYLRLRYLNDGCRERDHLVSGLARRILLHQVVDQVDLNECHRQGIQLDCREVLRKERKHCDEDEVDPVQLPEVSSRRWELDCLRKDNAGIFASKTVDAGNGLPCWMEVGLCCFREDQRVSKDSKKKKLHRGKLLKV